MAYSIDIYPNSLDIDYSSLLNRAKELSVSLISNRTNNVEFKACEVLNYHQHLEVLEFTATLSVNGIEKFAVFEARFEDGELPPENLYYQFEFEHFSA